MTTAVPSRPSAPWVLGDGRRLFLSMGLGLTAIAVAWWGASGTGRQGRQITWMVVGILGVVALGVGNFLWLLAGRRAVGARRSDVLTALEDSPILAAREATFGAGVAAGDGLVVVVGSDRVHRSDCLLVQRKCVEAATRHAALRPCEMCRP